MNTRTWWLLAGASMDSKQFMDTCTRCRQFIRQSKQCDTCIFLPSIKRSEIPGKNRMGKNWRLGSRQTKPVLNDGLKISVLVGRARSQIAQKKEKVRDYLCFGIPTCSSHDILWNLCIRTSRLPSRLRSSHTSSILIVLCSSTAHHTVDVGKEGHTS